MKKIFFFLLLFLSFSFQVLDSKNKETKNYLSCNNKVSQDYLNSIDDLGIKKIEIDVQNYRKWTVNSIKIITNGDRFVEDRYKKKFKSKVTVIYQNNSKCVFNAKVRHSGDAKDHIALLGNSIIQSLDIKLTNGNIRGITKFKLFKPDVRGVLDDVIIQTELLRELGYLAPRSIKVNSRVNQAESVMLFQEKAAKELLEFNSRREGPILEGDQKFFFKLVKDIPQNNLSNWEVGTPELRSKSIKTMLAKQTNAQLINKSEMHKNISLNSLSNLNLIYLYYSNRFQDSKNKFNFFDYDLDNTLLGLFDDKNILKLDVYNLLLQSTNSHHALSSSNRKFYWNSIENFFEPVNYDSNPDIERNLPTTTTAFYRLPISENFIESFDILEKNLKNLNIDKFHSKIKSSGLEISKENIKKKINKIIHNLNRIKDIYFKSNNKDLVAHNNFKPIEKIFERFNKTLNDIDPNVILVKHNLNNGNLERCKIYLIDCKSHSFSKKDFARLLEGELYIDKQNYQYLGKNVNFNNLKKYAGYSIVTLNDSTIVYDNGVSINIDRDKKTINIIQEKEGSKIFIINGNLKNFKIIFKGLNITKNEQTLNTGNFLRNYPVDINGITGCLSLINLKVKNIEIKADGSSCEDTVNFINVTGSAKIITIDNSFSDALDIDFSDLEISNINILNAGNDCVDFSSGKYKVKNLKLKNCGDKALSVGEKSLLTLDNIIAENAITGIASKDSSIVNLNAANFNSLSTCLSAYNKKQEFNGGLIKVKDMNCINYNNKIITDEFSNIIRENNNL